MSIACIIRAMAAAGASSEAIAIAVEAVEAVEAKLDAQRAKEAERSARYRARGGGKIPEEMRRAVFERDGHACVYCGSGDHLQCDHVQAVSKGGDTTIENLATACRTCNARKRDRDRKYVERHVRGKSADISGQSEIVPPTPPKTKVSPTPPSKTQTPTPPYSPPAPQDVVRLADVSEAIFGFQPAKYRSRSSRPDILDALKVQVAEGANPLAVMAALRAYYAQPQNREDDGKYAKGAHRLIQRGRWMDYSPTPRKAPGPVAPAELARRERHFRDTGEWRDDWGSKPQSQAA